MHGQNNIVTPHSVGLLWTSDQPDADTTHKRARAHTHTHTQHSQGDVQDPGGIRTRNPSTRAAVDPCLTPRGH